MEIDLKAANERADRADKNLMNYENSIRDQFAMAALTGIIANPKELGPLRSVDVDWRAEMAYQRAGEMMRKRRKLLDWEDKIRKRKQEQEKTPEPPPYDEVKEI